MIPSKKLTMSYVHCVGSEPLRGTTIGQLLDQAATLYPNIEAIIDITNGIRKTFQEVQHEVNTLACGLLSLGLQKGDRIAMVGNNSYFWYLTFFAAAKTGLNLVCVNPVFLAPELKYCFEKVDVKAVVCDETYRKTNYYELLCSFIPEIKTSLPGSIKSNVLPTLKTVVIITENNYPGTYTFKQVLNMATDNLLKKLKTEVENNVQFDDTCNIQFTSGTTGQPKATTLTHHGLVNNALFTGKRLKVQPGVDKACVNVQMFHSFGISAAMLTCMTYGNTIILPSPNFIPEASVKAISTERCTYTMGTPTMFLDMFNVVNYSKYDLSSLKIICLGGGPSSPELRTDIQKKTKADEVINGYGMTETGVVVSLRRLGDSPEKVLNTIGYPLDHVEVKLINGSSEVVPIGEPGECCVRGYLTMYGYWKDEEKTKEMITQDRWLHTGDLMVMDEDGYLKVVGRVKDMIIRGGENIFPREIEEHLNTHPDILDSQVVGVPDSRLGEEVFVWIRLHANKTLSIEEIKSYCKKSLSYYKIPRYIHFADEFPKTASGKIEKKKLYKEALKVLNTAKL